MTIVISWIKGRHYQKKHIESMAAMLNTILVTLPHALPANVRKGKDN